MQFACDQRENYSRTKGQVEKHQSSVHMDMGYSCDLTKDNIGY